MDGNVLGVDICQYFPPTESPYISFPHHHSILASQGVVNRDVLGLDISQYFTHSMCRRPKNAKAFDGATIYINSTKRNNLQALKKPKSQSSKTENHHDHHPCEWCSIEAGNISSPIHHPSLSSVPTPPTE